MLIGIVKKNAIMTIDFALERVRHEDKSPDEAIYEAVLLRFRPIMITTMAAIFGHPANCHRDWCRVGATADRWASLSSAGSWFRKR